MKHKLFQWTKNLCYAHVIFACYYQIFRFVFKKSDTIKNYFSNMDPQILELLEGLDDGSITTNSTDHSSTSTINGFLLNKILYPTDTTIKRYEGGGIKSLDRKCVSIKGGNIRERLPSKFCKLGDMCSTEMITAFLLDSNQICTNVNQDDLIKCSYFHVKQICTSNVITNKPDEFYSIELEYMHRLLPFDIPTTDIPNAGSRTLCNYVFPFSDYIQRYLGQGGTRLIVLHSPDLLHITATAFTYTLLNNHNRRHHSYGKVVLSKCIIQDIIELANGEKYFLFSCSYFVSNNHFRVKYRIPESNSVIMTYDDLIDNGQAWISEQQENFTYYSIESKKINAEGQLSQCIYIKISSLPDETKIQLNAMYGINDL